MKKLICLMVFLVLLPVQVTGGTLFFEATQDNTLFESPSGRLSNGAGQHMFTGVNVELTKRRAVIAFKDLSGIPAGATITSVKLHLNMSRENSDATIVNVHRLTADWGEGDSIALESEGQGTSPTLDDATWVHRFFDLRMWGNPGGDFIATSSAKLPVDTVGPYTFESSPGLIADVQEWVDNPSRNFGWILIGGENARTAKRWDTRENAEEDNRPLLEVRFSTTGTGWDYSGTWFDPMLDGEGYLVYQTPVGWIIYFFGYSNAEEPLWLVSRVVQLDLLEPGVPFDLEMLYAEPGTFDNPTPSTELQSYGTLSVTFFTCGTGRFVLDGLDGKKTSETVKIIGIDGTECEDPEEP